MGGAPRSPPYAIDSDAFAALRLASMLASVGQCAEAGGLISTIPDKRKDAAYREIRGVLHAKAGQIEEAFAMFDTLPRSLDVHRPIVAMLATAVKMMEQCRLAPVMSFVAKMAERYPSDLVTRALSLRCHALVRAAGAVGRRARLRPAWALARRRLP